MENPKVTTTTSSDVVQKHQTDFPEVRTTTADFDAYNENRKSCRKHF
jgi:hypothetical protein